jgi:hypothetical protein
MKQTLDTAPLYHSWDALMNSFIQVHEAISEQEKSQALRAHAIALIAHIDVLHDIVPDPDSISATPIPTQGATHSTHTHTTALPTTHTTHIISVP